MLTPESIQWGSFEPLKINQHMMICLWIIIHTFFPAWKGAIWWKNHKSQEVSKGKKWLLSPFFRPNVPWMTGRNPVESFSSLDGAIKAPAQFYTLWKKCKIFFHHNIKLIDMHSLNSWWWLFTTPPTNWAGGYTIKNLMTDVCLANCIWREIIDKMVVLPTTKGSLEWWQNVLLGFHTCHNWLLPSLF